MPQELFSCRASRTVLLPLHREKVNAISVAPEGFAAVNPGGAACGPVEIGRESAVAGAGGLV